MAKDGLFFKGAAQLNQHGVPAYALWVQAAWASILCLSGTYGDLLDYTTFASLLFYIITIGGIFVLRKKEPNTERPYKVLAYPFLPILYIISAITICLILLYTKPQNTWSGLFIVLLGAPFYFLVKAKSKKE
jgi:APA family basic amino acid/polyamine antiporter